MTVRAIRGAVRVDADTPEAIVSRTGELVAEVMRANGLAADDVVFILFTATQDLTSQFPAVAVGALGLGQIPRLCSVEMDVPGSMARVVRVVLFAEGDVPRSSARHVYLHGTESLVARHDDD